MTDQKNTPSPETFFAQANGAIDQVTGGLIPPIQPSTTYMRDEDNCLLSPDHTYGRDDNNLLRLAEDILCKAEFAEDGLLLPSGMAAVASIMRTVQNNGCIIMQSGIYWGATQWTREFCARRNIELIETDCSDMAALTAVARPADILWIETPSNPYIKTVDISACARIARQIGASLIVDSTAATPVLSQPLTLGADIVMHSATKAINGHSDVLAGFLACADAGSEIWQLLKADRKQAGAIPGSFETWLLIRGMRTLPLRMERMCKNARAIADFLNQHKQVDQVLYPGLPTDPGHKTASQQMKGGYGSLLSFCVKGNRAETLNAIGKLQLFKRATSLGGVESLAEHRHTIEDTVPENLIRLSVGIENKNDLLSDLSNALGTS